MFSTKKTKTPLFKKLNGVNGKVKVFDEKLHSKYDIDGREAIKNQLKELVHDNPDEYGEDLIFNTDEIPYKYLEVQVFSKWDCENFPYSLPFVYARKMRFSEDTLFVTLNKYYSEIIIFDKVSIYDKSYRLKKYDREMVNFVNWHKSVRMHIKNFTLDSIKLYAGINVPKQI